MDANEEVRRIADVTADLQRRFPAIPAQRVRSTVDEEWMQYLGARIRDYVPLLVRRQAIIDLREWQQTEGSLQATNT